MTTSQFVSIFDLGRSIDDRLGPSDDRIILFVAMEFVMCGYCTLCCYILLWVFCWNNNVDDDGGFHCYDNTYCTKFLQQTAEQKYDYTCWNRIDLSICIVVWWCDGSRKYGSK